jgi:hypothetical protein
LPPRQSTELEKLFEGLEFSKLERPELNPEELKKFAGKFAAEGR